MATPSTNATSPAKNGNGADHGSTQDAGPSGVRGRASAAYENTRGSVSDAARRTGETVTANPTAALAGGFAIGALLGFIVPAFRRETELLSPLGHRIAESARTSARQAAQASRQKLDEVTGQVVQKVGSAVVDAVGGETKDA